MYIAVCNGDKYYGKSVADIYNATKNRIDDCLYRFEGNYDRTLQVVVDYINNLLAHFFVSYGLNYTVGFPSEKMFKLEKYMLIRELGPFWWDISAIVMFLQPKTLCELKRILNDYADYVLYGRYNPTIRLVERLYGILEKEKLDTLKKLGRLEDIFHVLIKAIETHDRYYQEYWDSIVSRLKRIAACQESILNGSNFLDVMRDVAGFDLRSSITVFPLDVFRFGGGIYGVMTKDLSSIDIGFTTAYRSTLLCLIDAIHELGHPFLKPIMSTFEDLIKMIIRDDSIGLQGFFLEYVIDELAVVAYQHVIIKKIFGEVLPTHGWYETKNVQYIMDLQRKKGSFVRALELWIRNLPKNKNLLHEIVELAHYLQQRST